MKDDNPTENGGALAEAKETIARQTNEIERLRRRIEDERSAEALRQAITLAATVGTISSPVTHYRLLEMIVETAARVISARAASLFIIDEGAQELVFEVALGEKAEDVKKFRIPLGHGLAGLVAVTGQPMAISNAQEDPRHAVEIAQAVGYFPRSILCVPLFYSNRIIGVLELLDKEGASSFSASDIEILGLFANQAAVAIEQSHTHRNLSGLISGMLESLKGVSERQKQVLQQDASVFAAHTEEDTGYRNALHLAVLIQEIAWHGENEAKACGVILNGFVEYLRSKPELD